MKNLLTILIALLVITVSPMGVKDSLAEQADKKAEATQEKAPEAVEVKKQSPEDNEKSLKASFGRFYAALNTLFQGEVKRMQNIWSHAEDVTYMPPDGTYLVGWEQVGAAWEKQAALNIGGEIKPVDIHYNIGETIAVIHNYEAGQNFAEGKSAKVKIRATNVFRKENGEWKMIGHHTDILPFLVEEMEAEKEGDK